MCLSRVLAEKEVRLGEANVNLKGGRDGFWPSTLFLTHRLFSNLKTRGVGVSSGSRLMNAQLP